MRTTARNAALKGCSHIPILELAGQYMHLEKVSSYYHGLCPVHDDHNPSLCVWPEKNIWKCYACNQGGGPAEFLAFVEHIPLDQAIARLTSTAGDEIAISSMLGALAEKSRIRRSYDVRPGRHRRGWEEIGRTLPARAWWKHAEGP